MTTKQKIGNTINLTLCAAFLAVIIAGLLSDIAKTREITIQALLYEWLRAKDPLLLIVILPATFCLIMLIAIWLGPKNTHTGRYYYNNHNGKEHHNERR